MKYAIQLQPVQYGTLQSEAKIANSHKAYFNKFLNTGNVWIQTQYAQDFSGV